MTGPYVHPDLQFILNDAPPRPPLSHNTLTEFRAYTVPKNTKLHFENALAPVCHQISGPNGELDVYEYRPSFAPKSTAALLWMHGGGYVTGHGVDTWFGALFAERAGVRVFSVDYRLAPEHPFPAALEDSWAALNWLATHDKALGLSPARIAIGGASAGAGLAAGLAIHNRNQNGPQLAFQLLLYPMLDHKHENPAGYADVPRWSRSNSLTAWGMYLGGAAPQSTSVAATASDLSRLPPAFLSIGEADLFLDDVKAYAKKLDVAGVPQKIKTYAGVFHGAEQWGYDTSIGRRMSDDYVGALMKALNSKSAGV